MTARWPRCRAHGRSAHRALTRPALSLPAHNGDIASSFRRTGSTDPGSTRGSEPSLARESFPGEQGRGIVPPNPAKPYKRTALGGRGSAATARLEHTLARRVRGQTGSGAARVRRARLQTIRAPRLGDPIPALTATSSAAGEAPGTARSWLNPHVTSRRGRLDGGAPVGNRHPGPRRIPRRLSSLPHCHSRHRPGPGRGTAIVQWPPAVTQYLPSTAMLAAPSRRQERSSRCIPNLRRREKW